MKGWFWQSSKAGTCSFNGSTLSTEIILDIISVSWLGYGNLSDVRNVDGDRSISKKNDALKTL